MHTEEVPLMNFRIPLSLKEKFSEICRSRRTAMTSEINRMIMSFVREAIKEDRVLIKKDQKVEKSPERWGHLIKDPITHTWVEDKEYLG